MFKIELVADIERNYSISVNRDYNFLQNILWRNHQSNRWKCVELLTVNYGAKFVSCVSTWCFTELANLSRYDSTRAANAFMIQTYDELFSLKVRFI